MPGSDALTISLACPVCGCDLIDRMARSGLLAYIYSMLGLYPFRCRRCGKEFRLRRRTAP